MSLLSEYRRSLKLVEVEEPVDLVVYRPSAFLLVKAIYRTPITPNQITLFSILVGVLAGLGYGFGRRGTVLAGAALYAFSIVLDCADGQLARLKRNGTPLGRLLDGLVDYIVGFSVFVGLAVGFAPHGRGLRWAFLLAGLAVSYISHTISLDFYRNRFTDVVQGVTDDGEDGDLRRFREKLAALDGRRGLSFRRGLIRWYVRYCELQKKVTLQKKSAAALAGVDRELFRRRNKAAMRGWTWLGGSTWSTWLILSTLLGRIDLFFWGVMVVSNVWAVIMYVIQKGVDRRLAGETRR